MFVRQIMHGAEYRYVRSTKSGIIKLMKRRPSKSIEQIRGGNKGFMLEGSRINKHLVNPALNKCTKSSFSKKIISIC